MFSLLLQFNCYHYWMIWRVRRMSFAIVLYGMEYLIDYSYGKRPWFIMHASVVFSYQEIFTTGKVINLYQNIPIYQYSSFILLGIMPYVHHECICLTYFSSFAWKFFFMKVSCKRNITHGWDTTMTKNYSPPLQTQRH